MCSPSHSLQTRLGVLTIYIMASVIDGTPRDCSSPLCGAEDDTSIIRDKELGTDKASALGRTKGNGPVDAASAIATFMGNSTANAATKRRRGLLSDLLGGGKG